MGRAIGFGSTTFAGLRIAGELTYIPQHTKGGKLINNRCILPVMVNSNKGTNQKTGEQGRTDSFKLVAWGKLADIMAKSCPKGKALDAICEPHSYLGTVYNADGVPRLDSAGQGIQTTKIAFTIQRIIFGEEGSKTVAEEIAAGRRPVNWNVPNHADYQLFASMLQARQADVWDGRSPKHGYARVVVPQGPGIVLDFTQPAARTQQVVDPAALAAANTAKVSNANMNAGAAGGPSVEEITKAVVAQMAAADVGTGYARPEAPNAAHPVNSAASQVMY